MIAKILLSVCMLVFALSCFAQSINSSAIVPAKNIQFADTLSMSREQLLDLKNNFGRHKQYSAAYEKLVLAALSFFPELKDYRITFKVRNHGAPLSTRPSYGSMFRHARKREYMIFISSDTSNVWKDIQLNRVPQKAQIGIIGHEISHIIQFKEKSSVGLVGLGVNHISTRYMNRFEFQADSICVSHGMGEYLLSWAINARKAFGAPNPEQIDVEGELSNYSERYMSPATVRRYMKEMER